MSELLDKQFKLSEMVAELIPYILSLGYKVKIDYAKRCDKCPIGNPHSLHKQALAVDLMVFNMIDGKWHFLTSTEDYRIFGEYWQHLGGSWGGDFDDGDHFSLEHEGMR